MTSLHIHKSINSYHLCRKAPNSLSLNKPCSVNLPWDYVWIYTCNQGWSVSHSCQPNNIISHYMHSILNWMWWFMLQSLFFVRVIINHPQWQVFVGLCIGCGLGSSLIHEWNNHKGFKHINVLSAMINVHLRYVAWDLVHFGQNMDLLFCLTLFLFG